jgi:hypothetical protein
MNRVPFSPRMILIESLAFGLAVMAWLPALTPQAADRQPGKSAAPVATHDAGKMAAGAVKDTLKACLSRIPKDVSIDQRMTAETSCHRDEMDRKEIQVVPETEHASK